ncbi:hypothetical protein ABIB62_000787 [Mucilaginibacter sp. UYP25]|uniref:DUF1579 family protein n=1 Tax=unclassified Mucilaginibacter TaxID=2617802 RepID=UPI00339096B8
MKIYKFISIVLICASPMVLMGQAKPENTDMTIMLDLSRPGEMHEILSQLIGTWRFQDKKLAFVKGTLTRNSIYNDRFFNVEITGGKLQLPIRSGMKEDNYHSFQLEGYDNVKKQFITISINNHIGSDIQEQTGNYDAAKKQLSYEWESSILPDKKMRNRRIITFVDGNHYIEEYFEFNKGTFEKVRELDYIK